MQILLLGVFLALCTRQSLAVLNTGQLSSSFSDSKDKAAATAVGYQYNEPNQQYQSSADKQLEYRYQTPVTHQQHQQEQQELAAQYKATAQQYPSQSENTQFGYHYRAPSSQQQHYQHQQQPASIGANFYQHSGVGPAVALDVDNALPAKLPTQADQYFVQNQQPDLPTKTAGYNYFAPRPNQFITTQQQSQCESLPPTTAVSSNFDNSNAIQSNSNPNAPSERQNFLLQKLAQLNLLSGTRGGGFSAGQGHTNNLITSNQEAEKVANAQFTPTSSGQVASQVSDSFRQQSQDYAYARPAPTVSPDHYTNNKQEGAYYGGTAATTLSNFEYSKQQQASFGEFPKQLSPQTTPQLGNNEKYQQPSLAGNRPLTQPDRYYSQQSQLQSQLDSQSNGYNYAPQTSQANNGFNAGTQASFQLQNYAYPAGKFLADRQNALSQNEAGHQTSSYYQGSPSSQQQVLLQTSNSGVLLRGEQLQAQQQHSHLASAKLPSIGLPSNTYVYQKMQSQSYELPTIVQQGQVQPQSSQAHPAVRQPHLLYGIPAAERGASPVTTSAPAYSAAGGQFQASYF